MKKIICLFLALLMLIPFTVACANEKDNPTDVTTAAPNAESTATVSNESETEAKIEPDLPDVKYDGYTFNVANDFADSTKYTTNSIMADSLTGEPINDAIYARTLKIEDTYGVKIVDNDIDLTPIKNSIASGDDLFTIMTVDLSHVMEIVNSGYAVDLYNVNTIDFEKPWWDHNAEEKLSFNGHLYYTFSDFLITALDNARATYFNKDLITSLNLENPYELVKSGKWTIEKMRDMALAAVSDLNGDGKYNTSDRVGIANNATTFYEAMLTGCNAEIMKQGSDGNPYFCCFDEKEFFVSVYEKLLNIFSADNLYLITSTDDGRNMFINNNSLFTVDTLYMASKSRKEDVNFGILPIAKYDEAQEKYLQVSPNPHSIMIPVTTQDLDRTGVLLEALSYYSSGYYSDDALIPSYYDLALKYKSVNDVESAEMLTIIHDNISYVIKIIGTSFSSSIFSNFEAGNKDISSLIKRQEAAMKKLLDKTINSLK